MRERTSSAQYEYIKDWNAYQKRPKTDYTYARTASYSKKYWNNRVVSPNLSRRCLHTGLEGRVIEDSIITDTELIESQRFQEQQRLLQQQQLQQQQHQQQQHQQMRVRSAQQQQEGSLLANESSSTNRVYGTRSSTSGRANLSQYTTITTTTTTEETEISEEANKNKNNSSSEIVSSSTMVNQTKGSRRRAGSRTRSPARAKRSTKTRTTAYQYSDDGDDYVDYSKRRRSGKSANNESSVISYDIHNGLDDETDIHTFGGTSATYNKRNLVTETSYAEITTLASGTPLTVRVYSFFLFLCGVCRLFVHRLWLSFGQPMYEVFQRYLLMDAYVQSRHRTRRCAGCLLWLLLLLVPFLLLIAGICGLHAVGVMNVAMCGPLTGVHYYDNQKDITDSAFISDKIKNMLSGMVSWADYSQHHHVVVNQGDNTNWELMMDTKIEALRRSLETQLNTESAQQKQQTANLEILLVSVKKDFENIKEKINSLNTAVGDLNGFKSRVDNEPNYSDMITAIQTDLSKLHAKLGDVDDSTAENIPNSGLLAYLFNEIANVRQKVNEKVQVDLPCPDSRCVCENELTNRLKSLYTNVVNEVKTSSDADRTTVVISSKNGTDMSEELVKKMILSELETYSEDRTGMPDFALQSIGAQIVTTRCSQTYYGRNGLMTFLGVPLYHIHRDPSIVIQPGVVPGECWCFHGQSGSLVVELGDYVKFSSFSLEHISAKQSATGDILSAPKDIEVLGLTGELDYSGRKILAGRYDRFGPRLQFFPLKDNSVPPYSMVELRVINNWGQEEYTCLYRFRVHGKLQNP